MKLRHLDLFSGIGGFALGLQRTGGFETIGFCEIDNYCQKVLNKNFPGVPIFDDVRNLDADGLGRIDIITGGYPCQPFSTAGKRQGDQDDRHLWPAMFSLIQSTRPGWVIGENVAGHVSMGLDNVLSDLEGEGYTARPYIIPACAVDAKHRRDRVWIVAHTSRCNDRRAPGQDEGKSQEKRIQERHQDREPGQSSEVCAYVANTNRVRGNGSAAEQEPNRGKIVARNGDVADTISQRQPRQGQQINPSDQAQDREGQAGNAFNVGIGRKWPVESRVGKLVDGVSAGLDGCGLMWPPEPEGIPRVANKIPNRVNRLKGLGNAVVPQIPEILGNAILASIQQEATHTAGQKQRK